jgi:ABC-type phosphate transport system substrate-binding protein
MARVRAVGRWLAIVPLMLATAAQAAGNGALGATSQGSVSIVASVAVRASVEGPADVTFAGSSATSAANLRALCVSSNARLPRFHVAAIGSGPGGAFELSNGADVVRYSVKWPDAVLQTCGSGPGSGGLELELHPGDLALAGAERPYTGSLTLILAPD